MIVSAILHVKEQLDADLIALVKVIC